MSGKTLWLMAALITTAIITTVYALVHPIEVPREYHAFWFKAGDLFATATLLFVVISLTKVIEHGLGRFIKRPPDREPPDSAQNCERTASTARHSA